MDKEELVIRKLLRIASNQQKILAKLAQVVAEDYSDYLKGVAQVAAANAGFQATDVHVTRTEGHTGSTAGSTDTVVVEPGYIVTVKGAPKDNATREKYLNTFKTQVKTQKPGLEANLSIILED